MSIRNRLAGGVLAAAMALTAIGSIGMPVAAANSGHGGPLEAIADIEDAQASYAAGRFLIANQQAVIALRALRHLAEFHATIPLLTSIRCARRVRGVGPQGHHQDGRAPRGGLRQRHQLGVGSEPASGEGARHRGLPARRAGYDTAENALIDCVLNAVSIPPDFILELAF